MMFSKKMVKGFSSHFAEEMREKYGPDMSPQVYSLIMRQVGGPKTYTGTSSHLVQVMGMKMVVKVDNWDGTLTSCS